MTREEAIKKINAIKKYLITGNPIWDVKEIDEVLNMAIEALKQEPVKHGEWKYYYFSTRLSRRYDRERNLDEGRL